jgi:hypothetical protein
MKAQGPFWTALEGAGAWLPRPLKVSSRFRWLWEGHEADAPSEGRALAAMARPTEDAFLSEAPEADRVPGVRSSWLKGRSCTSPTALEGLAVCPFRSMAERVWGLGSLDAGSRLRMAVGTLAHHVLESVLTPFLGEKDWPAKFLSALVPDDDPETLLKHLQGLWEVNQQDWLSGLRDIPQEQWPQASLDLEAVLPNLTAALMGDAKALGPTKWEVAFLYPERLSVEAAETQRKDPPLQDGWTRTLLALEGELGPVALELGNGRSLAVAGKIDRLERWEHTEGLAFLRVVDYKTSKDKTLEAYAEEGAPFASHLQTPLYMLLAEALHGVAATAVLVPLREEAPKPFTKHMGTLAREEAASGSWRERLRRNLARLDARLENGDFPPTPGTHCQRCELSALCGRPVDVEGEEEGD